MRTVPWFRCRLICYKSAFADCGNNSIHRIRLNVKRNDLISVAPFARRTKHRGVITMALAAAVTVTLPMLVPHLASAADTALEEVAVTGIRASLQRAMDIKHDATGVVDAISAEDLGKFPDLNVAESLQRVTGVATDRSGGAGQAVTVRGLGPQFNTVLVNGRQLATNSSGREFDFGVLAAEQIVGAAVYKSSRADLQEGGIGATVSIATARPLNKPGLQVIGSVESMYESLAEQASPSVSFLVSNTFADDKFGILLAASERQREVQINRLETAGWRPGQSISNNAGDADPATRNVLFSNAYIPRNWDQSVDQQERSCSNANLVLQLRPTDALQITLDGFIAKLKVDSVSTNLAAWFEPDRVGSGSIDGKGTLISFTQEVGLHQGSGNPATDFVSHTRRSRDVNNHGFGIKLDWEFNEILAASFDASTSSAEDDRAGRDRFNVVGIINNYTFDGTGSTPAVRHDGFVNGSLPDPTLTRLHYNDKGWRPTDKDEINEIKLDFAYLPDAEIFHSLKFGGYRQERVKSQFQRFASQCAFCGYHTPAPNDVIGLAPFNANNFFPGLTDTYYSFDGDAYVQFLAEAGAPITPRLQNNRYTINENINSVYMDFTFGFDLGDMPLTINVGARYAETDVQVAAVQSLIADVVPTADGTLFSNVFAPATDIRGSDSYTNLLPGLSAKLEITEDIIVRLSVYDSMTRPTMSQLSPATTFNEPRSQNLSASGGDATLRPFKAVNQDVSFEWYYGTAGVASFAVFNKEIDNFIVTTIREETYTLFDRSEDNNFRCSEANAPVNSAGENLCAPTTVLDPDRPGLDVVAATEELNGAQEVYSVSRPHNAEAARVTGYELALTHVFDIGFGIAANATFVDSNISLNANTAETFALEGLGDSQNLSVFYEANNWQARVAFNNREGFLRYIDNASIGGSTGEPVHTNSFGQWDISASYDLTKHFTLFFHGINITEEELVQTGRFRNQIFSIEDNGSRYAVGVRGKF